MNKRIFAIAIAICIILPALAGALGKVKAASSPVLSLQPANVPPRNIGQTFTVTLHVDNVTNLWSWKVNVTWDPAYLTMTADPIEGSFLSNINGTLFLTAPYAKTPGVLNEMSDTSFSSLGATGSGDLATLTFTVIAHGYNTTAINLTNVVMQDFNSPITVSVVGATVSNTIPGDITGDGSVDIYDAIRLAGVFNSNTHSSNWNPLADLNGDGFVDIYDAIILANHFGQHL